MAITYYYKNNLYLNITNRCTMNCSYCFKNKWDWWFRGYNLKLKKEPSSQEVIKELEKAVKKHKEVNEVVFCGYGEPLMRLEVVKGVSRWLKDKGFKVRINTNGQANLYCRRNICPELKGLVDRIYVSLNAETAEKYFRMHKSRFGIKAFKEVLDFIKGCKKTIKDVTISTVAVPGIKIDECKKIAKKLGVKFTSRPYI